jgi:6-phosphogluconolactonase
LGRPFISSDTLGALFKCHIARQAGCSDLISLSRLAACARSHGHTASLVPGDPVLAVSNVEVALLGPYRGRRRMTLTYPAIDSAGRIHCVVSGAEERAMLMRLRDGDRSIPARRLREDGTAALVGGAAAGGLGNGSAR